MKLTIVYRPTASLRAYARNAKHHPKAQVAALARSIKQYGFNSPVLVDADGILVAGHCRVAAARELNIKELPTVCVSHLTPEQIRAFRIADNRLGELGEWDFDALKLEIADLPDLETGWHPEAFTTTVPEALAPKSTPGHISRQDEHSNNLSAFKGERKSYLSIRGEVHPLPPEIVEALGSDPVEVISHALGCG